MTDFIVVPHATEWRRLKAVVLGGISSPITCRVYHLRLDPNALECSRRIQQDRPARPYLGLFAIEGDPLTALFLHPAG